MKSLFDGEFEYEHEEELEEFLSVLTPGAAITIIEMALNHANKQGGFDVIESFSVYKCLTVLNKIKNGEGKNGEETQN